MGSSRAVPGDVALFLWGPEPAGDQPVAAGARGTMPSIEGTFGAIEGSPGLWVFTSDDFVLRPKASRAFVAASSLLRSGEVERSLAQRPLEELEVRLVVAALQVVLVMICRVRCWVLSSSFCLFPSFVVPCTK